MTSSFIKGPLQMIASSFFFALMAYYAKLASARIPAVEVAFIRFAVGALAVLILASFGRVDLRTRNKGLLIMRGTFGGVAILLYFLAMAGGSMTNSTILNSTYPIFSTLLAIFTLHERISWPTGLSLAVAWIGVGFLMHPDFHHVYWPDLLGLLSGVLSGLAVTMVRELRLNNESAWNVFFYLSVFGCLFSLLLAVPVWVWPNLRYWILLLVTGLLALIAQLMMTSAYKYCSTALGGVLSMTTMIFTAILGIFIVGERLTEGETVGALLILFGSILVVWLTAAPRIKRASNP
jgi:drug/metabolite transporter (DMT)-like permease